MLKLIVKWVLSASALLFVAYVYSGVSVATFTTALLAALVIGLLISVPIVVFGSKVVLKLVERFPIIIQLGAAVLAFTAAKMIVSEPLLDAVFDPHAIARWTTYAVCIAGVLGGGWWATRAGRAAGADAGAGAS